MFQLAQAMVLPYGIVNLLFLMAAQNQHLFCCAFPAVKVSGGIIPPRVVVVQGVHALQQGRRGDRVGSADASRLRSGRNEESRGPLVRRQVTVTVHFGEAWIVFVEGIRHGLDAREAGFEERHRGLEGDQAVHARCAGEVALDIETVGDLVRRVALLGAVGRQLS